MMNDMDKILDTLKGVTGIQSEYVLLVIVSIMAVIIITFINKIINNHQRIYIDIPQNLSYFPNEMVED